MKIRDVITIIEAAAPLKLQEDYDNGGLNIGIAGDELSGVLVCVDVTEDVVDEAVGKGANLIVSHHPLLFRPLRRIGDGSHIESIVRRCIKENISVYASHTALDRACQGVSSRMADIIGLRERRLLVPHDHGDGTGFGVVGELGSEESTMQFLEHVKKAFGCEVIRHSSPTKDKVKKIAVSSGAGGAFINDAREAGADIFITADLRYHDFFSSADGIMVADVGHFESEYCSIDLLYDIIIKKIPTFAVHKSRSSSNPVQYLK